MEKYLLKIILGMGLLIGFSFSANAQWVQLTTGNSAVLSVIGDKFIMGTDNSYVFISSDNGSNWDRISYQVPGLITGIRVLAVSGSTIYAGSATGLFMSADTGKSWTADTAGLTCKKIKTIAASGSNVVAGTNCSSDNGVFFSTKSGESLVKCISGLPLSDQFVSSAIVGNTIYVGTTILGGTFSSVDNGANWISTTASGLTDKYITCFAVNGSTIFAGSATGKVFRSTNSGTSWTKFDCQSSAIKSIAVSENNVFVGTSSKGVFRSTDNGETWSEFNTGLTNKYVLALAVSKGDLLAVAIDNNYTYSGPVWRYQGAVGVNNHEQRTVHQEKIKLQHTHSAITVAFSLTKTERVTMSIYNLLGHKVATMINKNLDQGAHSIKLNTMNLAKGCYTLRIHAGSETFTQRISISR